MNTSNGAPVRGPLATSDTTRTPTAAWPAGLPRSLSYPTVTVGSLLRASARRYSDRVAIRHATTEYTYTELWRSASAFADALRSAGIGPGQTVMLHMPNCPEYAIAYFGTLLSGATFSPANPLLPPGALLKQLTDCAASVVVTHVQSTTDICATPSDFAPSLNLVVVVGKRTNESLTEPEHEVDSTDFVTFLNAGDPDSIVEPDLDIDQDLAHIAYTGGTTGLSKGVELTHRNVVSNILQYACWNHGSICAVDDHGDVVLDQIGAPEEWPVRLGTGVVINLTPWFHAMGCIGSLSVPLLAGVTIILHDRFEPTTYLADAENWEVTSMSGAPAMFAALLASPDLAKRDLGSVRALSSGGGPLPHEHIRLLSERFPDSVLCEGYGLTEATMGVTLNPTSRSSVRKPGTVGLAVFDTEVGLFDPLTGERCEAGTPGEICIRGPQVMRGYRNRPEETAAALVDGWLHTGDLGVFDDDGYLTVVDRLKDMLIYKGYNVYPREIEELLIAHPSVRAAAVVGRPDPEVGEIPVAFVVPANAEINTDEVVAAVNAELLPYKRVRELLIVDQIPVSAAGKILKRDLRQQLTNP